jgi:hypothetical protein
MLSSYKRPIRSAAAMRSQALNIATKITKGAIEIINDTQLLFIGQKVHSLQAPYILYHIIYCCAVSVRRATAARQHAATTLCIVDDVTILCVCVRVRALLCACARACFC